MRKKITFLLICIFLLPTITSCYDAREIDDWAYVYTIGIDKGVSDKLRMTLQIPTLKGETGGGEGGGGVGMLKSQQKGDFTVMSMDCPSFYSGINLINTSLSRKLNYTHAKFFVISEDLAREDIGFLMSAFARERQIRRTMHLIVARGKAMDFVSAFNPVVGTAISKTQEGMMNMENETGLFDDTTFGQFLDSLKSSKVQPTAVLASINYFNNFLKEGAKPEAFKSMGDYYAGELPRFEGNKLEYLGTAIFDGGKLAGELNGDETRALLMAKGDFKYGSIAIPDPISAKYADTLILRQQKKPDIKVEFENGKPVINLKVFIEGDLQAIQSEVNYESPKYKPILEDRVKTIIKDMLDKTIDKCKNLNCDVFNFGEQASMKFLTIQKWEAYDWLRHFKEAEITTDVEFTIRRTGTMVKTNPVKTSEGEK